MARADQYARAKVAGAPPTLSLVPPAPGDPLTACREVSYGDS